MSREAMKQPEALRLADALDAEFVQGRISNSTGRESAVELRRLHEALETEQEPVAYLHNETELLRLARRANSGDFEPSHWRPLYTTPPKQWVGLTDQEIHEIDGYEEDRKMYRFARAIEQALKEKNA